MPERDIKLYLNDIKEACENIYSYTKNMELKIFAEDKMRRDAVIRNLEVIGEAVKKIPDEIMSKYPDMEWRKIAGLRDILIHHYFGINYNIIWDAAKNKVPALKEVVELMLKESF